MTITGASLNGYYKVHYGEKQRPIPAFGVVQRLLPFSRRAKTGKTYNEPIFVQRSHGVTFARTAARTAYTLNAARSLQSEEASMSGAEITLRENLAYGALAASEGGEGISFGSAFDEAVLGIEESHRFYIETNCLYGGKEIGIIDTITDAGDTGVLTITITKQSWAPGLWAQAENALVDVWTAVGGTKRNATGTVVVTTFGDPQLRQIVLTFSVEAEADLVQPGDVIEFVAADGETMDGIDKIVTNTGVQFGIDASVFGVWRANVIDAGNTNLTFGKCLTGQTAAVQRGGMGEMTYLTNPLTWQDLAEDQAALRRYGEVSTEFKNGAERLVFSGTGGRIVFEQHPMVKCGDAFGLQLRWWLRGGESDLVSQLPGANNKEFFQELQDNAGFQMRNFSSMFIYCRRPSAQVKIMNIIPRAMQ